MSVFGAAKGFISGDYIESAEAIANLISGWNFFLTTEVVVGITEETNVGRGKNQTNASLLYQNEQGCPAQNIPPRPVLQPAIAQPEVKKQIEELMMKAAESALVFGNQSAAEGEFHKAGMVGRDACKKYISDGSHLAPNAPRTIAIKGSSTPLVDTGSMLGSITYAVRKK